MGNILKIILAAMNAAAWVLFLLWMCAIEPAHAFKWFLAIWISSCMLMFVVTLSGDS